MRLNTKGRFAVTAMIDLAMRCDHGPVALAAIGRRQWISLSYLEQLFGRLRRRELVKSSRGPGGGYSLGRGAADISVADIIAAVDEAGDAGCDEGHAGPDGPAGRCVTQALWAGLDARMQEYLASVSLKALVDDQIARGVTAEEVPTRRPIWAAPVARPFKLTTPNSVFALGASLSPSGAGGT
jgi:Rrf2 family transcriptional regulator, iron-sulfur cluster assembly transcription factor